VCVLYACKQAEVPSPPTLLTNAFARAVYTVAIAPSPSGDVTFELGGTTLSAKVSLPSHPPVPGAVQLLKAIVATPDVWIDDPVIRVAVQVIGRSAGAAVTAAGSPSSGAANASTAVGRCVPDTASNLCVITIPVPPSWFDRQIDPLYRNLLVRVGVDEDNAGMPHIAGVATLHPPAIVFTVDEIVVEIPSTVLAPDQEFPVVVRRIPSDPSASPLSELTVELSLGPHLHMGAFTFRTDIWRLSSTVASPRTSGVLTMVRRPGAPAAPDDGELFTVTITVVGNSASQAIIAAVIISAATMAPVASLPTALFVGRRLSRGDGIVYIDTGVLRGVFLRQLPPLILNTAAVTGRLVSVSLQAVGVLNGGLVALPSPGIQSNLTCASDSTALNARADCSAVFLNGLETTGADDIEVSASVDNVAVASVTFTWRPAAICSGPCVDGLPGRPGTAPAARSTSGRSYMCLPPSAMSCAISPWT